MTDQLPPHSIECEMGVLGCIIQDPTETLTECAGKIPEDAFYDLRHRILYSLALAAFSKSEPLDMLSIVRKLREGGVLEQIGGLDYLTKLESSTPSALNLSYYVPDLLDKWTLRKLIQGCSDVVGMAVSGASVADVISAAEAALCVEMPNASPIFDGKKASDCLINDLERRHQLGGKLSGIDTGFWKLNKLTEGLQYGEQTLIAARPSMGKTAIGLNIIKKVVFEDKIPVLFISLEMSIPAVMRRLLSDYAAIPMTEIRRGTYSQGQFAKFTAFQVACRKSPLHIIDGSGGMGIGELSAITRRHVRKNGIKLVVIDYLQKIKPSEKHEKRTYEVGETSQRLKGLAVETGSAFLTMAQLNRESEKDKGRAPKLSDLADSGQIERDADTVALIHRKRDDETGATSLIIAKQRDGELGLVPLIFNGTFCRFENAPMEQNEERRNPHAD